MKILVIGDACEDIYIYGECNRLSPEAPIPVFVLKNKTSNGGMALNTFANLQSLGCDCEVVHNTEKIKKTRYVDKKTNHIFLRVDTDDKQLNRVDPKHLKKDFLNQYGAIVISDYNKGFITHSNIPEILTFLKLTRKPIFVDSKKEDLSLFEGCIIKINEKEYKNIKKLPEEHELIVTLGKKGARWRDEIFPAVPTNVFDVCGAGDTFIAAMATKYLKCSDMRESIRFANKCASVAVRHVGAYSVSEEDLNE